MLHYPVWDSKKPFGVDIPMHMRKMYGDFTTGTVKLKVYDVSNGKWIDHLPLAAWDTKNCNGPLTVGDEIWREIPN